MRLMHLISSGGWGGREMYPPLLAAEQKPRGHQVSLVAKTDTPLAGWLAGSDLDFELMKVKSRLDLEASRNLSVILRQRSPELIHLHLSRDLTLVSMACALARIRPAVILHQHVTISGSKRDPFHRYLYRKLSAIVAVSDFVRRSIVHSWPVKGRRVEVIFNGLKPEVFAGHESPDDEQRIKALRAELGAAGERDLLAAVVGRLEPQKGQEVFLRAAAAALARETQLRFAVVGNGQGDYHRALKRLAEKLGVAGKVVFAGHQPDVPRLMRALDVLVVPSLEESFGLVAAEGMLSSLPVVAARAGALPEFISHGETGLLVPPADPEALAESLLRLAEDAFLRDTLGRQARSWAVENLSLERCLDRLDNLYNECLNKPG